MITFDNQTFKLFHAFISNVSQINLETLRYYIEFSGPELLNQKLKNCDKFAKIYFFKKWISVNPSSERNWMEMWHKLSIPNYKWLVINSNLSWRLSQKSRLLYWSNFFRIFWPFILWCFATELICPLVFYLLAFCPDTCNRNLWSRISWLLLKRFLLFLYWIP